jgi:hypothetical protein
MQPPKGAAPEQPPLITEFQQRHFEDCFTTEADRVEFLRSMSLNDFHAMLSWANYQIRGVDHAERGYLDLHDVDGVVDNTGHVQYVSPSGGDRVQLMEAGFAAAQEVDDPIIAGAILGLTIVNTRPFPEANDTTAHLAFTLMSRGYNGTQEDIDHYSKIFSGETRQSMWDTCNIAGLPHRFAAARTYDVAAEYNVTDHIPIGVVNYFPRHLQIQKLPKGDPRRDIAAMADEPILNRAVLTEFVLRAGRDLRNYIVVGPSQPTVANILHEIGDGSDFVMPSQGNLYLDASAIISDVQPHDAELLWDVYRGIKRDYVQSIIECFRGDQSIHGDWRVILSYFYRLKGDIPPEASHLPEQQPGSYDPVIQAVRLVMETMGVTSPTAEQD